MGKRNPQAKLKQIVNLTRKLTPYNIQKGFRYLKHFGIKEFLIRLQERTEPEEVPYGPWYEKYRPTNEILEEQKIQSKSFLRQPRISILVPAYETPPDFLCQMMDSVIAQTYENWELCIANASPGNLKMQEVLKQYSTEYEQIRVVDLTLNEGISENTNAALRLANGELVGLLDHDDLLASNALFEVVKVYMQNPNAGVFYSDEDKVTTDLREHFQPHFKPDFNLDLLRSNNYVCHFFVVETKIARKIGGFSSAFNGAQDYDFIFRCIGACKEEQKKVVHIPEILYHWRVHKASTADNPVSKLYAFEAGKRAIEENLKSYGVQGEVLLRKDLGFYQVKYAIKGSPLVSILIPNKDRTQTLKACIQSIKKKTTYNNYEIIIIENNSKTSEIKDYYKELEKEENIQILSYEGEFNYSAINNFGETKAKGDYLLFLNNDIEVIEESWMEELLSFCQRKEVGIVGAKLLYPDNTLQHAGLIVGLGGIAGHVFLNLPANRSGYMHKASLAMDYTAVTAACMMMKTSVFHQLGGFEEKLSVAFSDVDLCIRTNEAGYLVVYNPEVKLYHHESKSRGCEDNKERVKRFQQEIEYMRTKHEKILREGDPYYNRNLSLTKRNYSLKSN